MSINQAWLDEIKWFVCLFKLIWWSMSIVQIWPTRRKKSILFIAFFYMNECHLYIYILSITIVTWHLIICKNGIILKKKFQQIFICEKNTIFWNIQEYFILEMKNWKYIDYFINMCWSYLCTTSIMNIEVILKILWL